MRSGNVYELDYFYSKLVKIINALDEEILGIDKIIEETNDIEYKWQQEAYEVLLKILESIRYKKEEW